VTIVGDLLLEFKERPAPGDEPPVLTLTERTGFVRQADRFHKRLATEDVSNYKVVRRHDIAFNPYLLWAGAVAQNTIVERGIISPLYPTFRVRDGHEPRYVARLLLTPQLIAAYDGIAFGSVPRRRRSSVKDFLALPLANVPGLPEQRRIAAVLDQADALRAKRRQVLVHLDGLADSIFNEMFAGSLNPVVSLGDIATVKGGKRLPKGAQYADTPTPHPYIRVTDLRNGAIRMDNLRFLTPDVQRQISRYTVKHDDVIISIAGSIGLTAAVPPALAGANLTENAAKIVAKDQEAYMGAWLARALLTRPLQDQIAGKVGQVTIGKLALFRIEELQIPLPPPPLQREFLERTAKIDLSRIAVQRATTTDDELFASLQARAFAGDL
jgi:type I restriction enzyme S subunit